MGVGNVFDIGCRLCVMVWKKNALHDMVRKYDVNTSGFLIVSCRDFASCSNERILTM